MFDIARKEKDANRGVASQSKRVDQLQGDTAALLLKTSQGKTEWRLDTVSGTLIGADDNGTPIGADGTAQYSYSFFFKLGEKSPTKSSILHYGTPTAASPGIWQVGNRIEAQVSLRDNPGFNCLAPGPLSKSAWSYVAVAVGPKHVRLFMNGKLVKQCSYKGDTVKILHKNALQAPGGKGPLSFGGFGEGTDAMIKELYYYPGARLTEELVRAQMTLHNFHQQEKRAVEERTNEANEAKEAKKAASKDEGELDAYDQQLMREETEMSDSMNKAMLAAL